MTDALDRQDAAPIPDDVIERAARAWNPQLWAAIDRLPHSPVATASRRRAMKQARAALEASGLAAEVERLTHDIERHIAIASSEFERAEAGESRIAELERAASGMAEQAAQIVERWALPTIQTPSMWLIDKAGIAAEIRALAEENPA